MSATRPATKFGKVERQRQARFREGMPAPTDPTGQRHGHLLALGRELDNLYPTLRGEDGARRFFAERAIKWWQDARNGDDSNGTGPTRNMASSQIACVNFHLPLADIPEGLLATARALDDDVTDIVPICDQSPIEFEWIGLGHALEGPEVTSRGGELDERRRLHGR